MMLSNLNLSSLPECNFEVRYVDSVLLNPCAKYQRLLRMGKVARIAANFSEYIANEPKVSYRDGRYFVFDGQNTIEARKTCNGGRDLPIRCKVFYGHSKEHEALLFAVQTGISSELTAGEQLRAKLVAHEENACDFAAVTENTGVRFALDGIRAPWKIYCIRSAYYIYKSYGAALYREMLSILVDVWDGDSDSFLSGILHGMARFLALYQGEYSRERLVWPAAHGASQDHHPAGTERHWQRGGSPHETDPVHLQRCWSCSQSALQAVMSMIPVNRKFLRGDIYYANLEPHLGSEQGGIRPVVVVQNNTANCYSPNLIVAPVTSNTAKKPDHQAHVLVDGNRAFLQPSMILAESVQTISKGRLIRPMGRLSIPELIRLNYALLYQLDLNEWVWRKEAYERYLRYHR